MKTLVRSKHALAVLLCASLVLAGAFLLSGCTAAPANANKGSIEEDWGTAEFDGNKITVKLDVDNAADFSWSYITDNDSVWKLTLDTFTPDEDAEEGQYTGLQEYAFESEAADTTAKIHFYYQSWKESGEGELAPQVTLSATTDSEGKVTELTAE